jgi:hypothetical protein
MAGDRQYAEILVNGKTGQRHIPLIYTSRYGNTKFRNRYISLFSKNI